MSLDLTAKGFSLTNAKELALFARLAYEAEPTIQNKETDTQLLIRDLGSCAVIAFRGTSSLRDFMTDANCLREGIGDGQEVHSGFYAAFKSIFGGALSQLSDKPVFITGHSLGGALAILFAEFLSMRNFVKGDAQIPILGVYTFGCPRVGNKKFQTAYNARLLDRTFTVINDCDLVPRIPGWLSGYRRPGHDAFISALDSTQVIIDPSLIYRLESDVWSMVDAWRARHNPTFLDQLLTDHHINRYIAALERIEPEDAEPPLTPVQSTGVNDGDVRIYPEGEAAP